MLVGERSTKFDKNLFFKNEEAIILTNIKSLQIAHNNIIKF